MVQQTLSWFENAGNYGDGAPDSISVSEGVKRPASGVTLSGLNWKCESVFCRGMRARDGQMTSLFGVAALQKTCVHLHLTKAEREASRVSNYTLCWCIT